MHLPLLTLALPVLAYGAAIPIPALQLLQARAPPNVPTAAAAKTSLAALTVAAAGPQTGYSRDLFPRKSLGFHGQFQSLITEFRLDHHLRSLQHPRDCSQA